MVVITPMKLPRKTTNFSGGDLLSNVATNVRKIVSKAKKKFDRL